MMVDPDARTVELDEFRGMSDSQFEQLFDDKAHQEQLRRYFGDAVYEDIVGLRRQARRRRQVHEEHALILPGIMGSELALVSPAGDENLVWLDYWDIVRGNLFGLKFDAASGSANVRAVGALRRYYYLLKTLLESLDYQASFFPFDWRLSSADNGLRLARHIAAAGRPVHIVAHSMGGLVARVAATPGQAASAMIKKVVMLGTPNFGSFSPVLAFRGNHEIARKIAFLDLHHSNDDYRSQLYMGFPGLYEMLPSSDKVSVANLFQAGNWPRDIFALDAGMLAGGLSFQTELFPGDARFFLIAGVNQETIVAAEADAANEQFVYDRTMDGDGTVPLACCLLDGVPTYYTNTEHGALPNDKSVGYAAYDLLREGKTTVLETEWIRQQKRSASPARLTDRDLFAQPLNVGREISTEEQKREFLSGFLSVKGAKGAASTPEDAIAASPEGPGPRAISICIVHGNLIHVKAPAYTLALYEEITPTVAARAVDRVLGGALLEQIRRRNFDGRRGKISFLPTSSSKLLADNVALIGLGPIDRFEARDLHAAGEVVAQAFAQGGIPEITSLPIGLGTGVSIGEVVRHFVGGLLEGLRKHDPQGLVRGITLCDLDKNNCEQLETELRVQAPGSLFSGFEAQFSTMTVPGLAKDQGADTRPDPIYLMIRMGETLADPQQDAMTVDATVLAGGQNAAVAPSRQALSRAALIAHLDGIGKTDKITHEFGVKLAGLLLAPPTLHALDTAMKVADRRPLVIIHDRAASIVPWEAMSFDWRRYPASNVPMSRRYLTDNLPAAASAKRRERGEHMSMLLVADPTGDLPGAWAEAKQIQQLAEDAQFGLKVEPVFRKDATRQRLLAELGSGRYDIVHYAGHAFFDPADPGRSGLICAGDEPLTGEDVAHFEQLPGIVFFNACEAGRIRRGRGGQVVVEATVERAIERNVGLAEAFLRAGALNYVGTYWPVGDGAAKVFARAFYQRLIRGETIGEAIYRARQQVLRNDELAEACRDWADYIHYGDPDYRIIG